MAKQYKRTYAHSIPTRVLGSRLSGFVHAYTLYSYLRPFCVATLIAGYDPEDGYQLRLVEPSGLSFGYFAAAVGKGATGAKTELEKLKCNELTCEQVVKEMARIIYSVHDEVKDKDFELEMSWLCAASNQRVASVPKEKLDAAIAEAKASLESDSDEDMD